MAAAGILVGGVGMGTAKGADLGGDCCADLEERVAELEATTVRKGNRKVNLTISGQINRTIMYFNDGSLGRTVAGVENRVDSSRFIFTGDAKINSRLKAGFEMNVEWAVGATSDKISNAPGFNAAGVSSVGPNIDGGWGGDGAVLIRTSNWFLEDKDLGRVAVGRINTGGPVATIDVGGIGQGAASRKTLISNGLLFRNSATGGLSSYSGTAVVGACVGCNRMEGIVWESQSLGGLLLRAAWGENDIYSGSARWAGEYSGFQLAAGIGIEKTAGNANFQRDFSGTTGIAAPVAGLIVPATGLAGPGSTANQTIVGGLTVQSTGQSANTEWAWSLAGKHVASGLFAQGHYQESDFDCAQGKQWCDKKSNFWLIQGGIAKNWFGIGETAIYGEYGEGKNGTYFLMSGNPGSPTTSSAVAPVGDRGHVIGFGINQKVDSAAMELYIAYNRYTLDSVTDSTANFGIKPAAQSGQVGGVACAAGAGCPSAVNVGGVLNNNGPFQGIDSVIGGARIRF